MARRLKNNVLQLLGVFQLQQSSVDGLKHGAHQRYNKGCMLHRMLHLQPRIVNNIIRSIDTEPNMKDNTCLMVSHLNAATHIGSLFWPAHTDLFFMRPSFQGVPITTAAGRCAAAGCTAAHRHARLAACRGRPRRGPRGVRRSPPPHG